MDRIKWSPEKELVFLFKKNLCVSAGAGSGKTAAIVELNSRFLSGDTSIEDRPPLTIDEILAITFTDKAAGEMKERIRKMIDERLRSEREPLKRRRWIDARRALLSAHISTFHSFCHRMLREHPLEAGIDPRFEVAREKQAAALLEECATRLVLQKIQARDATATQLVMDYGMTALVRMLMETLATIRSSGESTAILEDHFHTHEEKALRDLEDARGRLVAALAAIFDAVRTGQVKKETKFADAAARLSPSFPSLEQAILSLSASSPSGNLKILDELHGFLKGSVPAAVKGLCAEGKAIADPKAGEIMLIWRFFQSLPMQHAFASLLSELEIEYRQEKKSMALLDFDDLLRLACDMLRNNKTLRRKYKKAYRVILVDEFQDTNELQREIVYLLAEKEGDEHSPAPGDRPEKIALEPRKLFVVGDAKQSIYLFRGADVEVFSRVIDDVKSKGGEVVSFSENFRTLDAILEVINPLFGSLMQGGTGSAFIRFQDMDHLRPRRQYLLKESRVELILTADEGSASARRALEADAIARRICLLGDPSLGVTVIDEDEEGNPLQRPAQPGDVALLFRTLTHVRSYEQALRAYNIPYYLVKGRGFFRCQEVLDILNVLRYLSGIHRDVSLAGVLRSPLSGTSDETLIRLAMAAQGLSFAEAFRSRRYPPLPHEEHMKLTRTAEILSKLEDLRDTLPVGELIGEIISSFDLEAVLLSTFQGAQKVANIRKLVNIGRSYEKGTVSTLEAFVFQMEKEVREESLEAEAQLLGELEGTVKIMTIHQAKGLEFPVVIVPDLGRTEPGRTRPLAYAPGRGIACRYIDSESGDAYDNYLYKLIKDEYGEKEQAESLRLLYVALTRARDYLVLTGAPIGKKKEGTWREKIHGFLGREVIDSFTASGETEKEVILSREGASFPRRYNGTVKLLKEQALSLSRPRRELAPVDAEPSLAHPGSTGKVEENPDEALPLFSRELDKGTGDLVLARCLDCKKPLPSTLFLTPTHLLTFHACERKYLYDSLMRHGEGAGMPLDSQSPEEIREAQGWAMHRILQELDFLSDRETQRGELEHQLLKIGQGKPDLFKRTKHIMQAVLRFLDAPETARLGFFDAKARLYREHPFFLRVEAGVEVFLHGTIDLIIDGGKGPVHLVDYKYSHADKDKPSDYRIQLLSYAMAVKNTLPHRDLDAFLIFMSDDSVEFRQVDVADAALGRFRESLALACGKMRDRAGEEEWPMAERKICTGLSCPYRARCWY
ncbi:MAG: UvrD-helicase domain-containing protein [Candidatus Eremiobacteraeota bacterium]|nr:UvrD-helicase domain-containing protein [Candidatus Eremiobacteraeota bacterium]